MSGTCALDHNFLLAYAFCTICKQATECCLENLCIYKRRPGDLKSSLPLGLRNLKSHSGARHVGIQHHLDWQNIALVGSRICWLTFMSSGNALPVSETAAPIFDGSQQAQERSTHSSQNHTASGTVRLTGNANLRLSRQMTFVPQCHCYLLHAL